MEAKSTCGCGRELRAFLLSTAPCTILLAPLGNQRLPPHPRSRGAAMGLSQGMGAWFQVAKLECSYPLAREIQRGMVL